MEKKIIFDNFILRKPKIKDAQFLFKNYSSNIDIAYYTSWKVHIKKYETKNFLKMTIKKWDEKKELNYVIEKKQNKEILGLIKILFLNKYKVQLGYALIKKHWNKGIMTKVLKTVINYLFIKKNVKKIVAFCDIENKASEKVMKKSGMKFVKILKNYIIHPNISTKNKRDCLLYEINYVRK